MTDLMQRWIDAMRDERFEDAWALSAQTLAARDPATRDDPAQPYHLRWVWDGTPLDGRDVLVRCYHGLGDTLQFARFLPRLAEQAASVTVEVQPRLVPLLETLAGINRLVPFDPSRPTPRWDVDVEITELPFALRARPDSVRPPYLRAPRAPLPPGTVGICYEAGEWDRTRCIPPALFAPICREHACLTLVSEPTSLAVLNPDGCPFDMKATASLVASCALVITVDTMIAHLAGALGRPTWLLLKAEPDWRWTPGATRSPWYSAMRLYAQPRPGDWQAVVDTVARDLSNFIEEGASAHDHDPEPVGARVLG
jgi:hypothetical protein